MIDLSLEQWRDLGFEIEAFEDSLLHEAMVETYQKRLASRLVELDNPKSPENMTNFARGCRFELIRATMIIGSLKRSVQTALKKPDPEGD